LICGITNSLSIVSMVKSPPSLSHQAGAAGNTPRSRLVVGESH
jgi:hypothetical protein